eukprot:1893878-Pleurochrysis_carterae.AAC.2
MQQLTVTEPLRLQLAIAKPTGCSDFAMAELAIRSAVAVTAERVCFAELVNAGPAWNVNVSTAHDSLRAGQCGIQYSSAASEAVASAAFIEAVEAAFYLPPPISFESVWAFHWMNANFERAATAACAAYLPLPEAVILTAFREEVCIAYLSLSEAVTSAALRNTVKAVSAPRQAAPGGAAIDTRRHITYTVTPGTLAWMKSRAMKRRLKKAAVYGSHLLFRQTKGRFSEPTRLSFTGIEGERLKYFGRTLLQFALGDA